MTWFKLFYTRKCSKDPNSPTGSSYIRIFDLSLLRASHDTLNSHISKWPSIESSKIYSQIAAIVWFAFNWTPPTRTKAWPHNPIDFRSSVTFFPLSGLCQWHQCRHQAKIKKKLSLFSILQKAQQSAHAENYHDMYEYELKLETMTIFFLFQF